MIATFTQRVCLALALTAVCFTGATQARADFNIEIGRGGFKIGVGHHKKQPQKKYAVTLYRPKELGGGRVYSRRDLTHQQALDYTSVYEEYHWVVWKYAGIGKSYQGKRFSSYAKASAFLKNKGPAKAANKLGIAIIAKQYIASGRVTMD